jgi:hypothetical protein
VLCVLLRAYKIKAVKQRYLGNEPDIAARAEANASAGQAASTSFRGACCPLGTPLGTPQSRAARTALSKACDTKKQEVQLTER